MKLHCLGTTGYHPSPKRHTACYYIPDMSLVLDAGTGLFELTKLLRSEPKQSLDLLLSHAHLDHIVGLTFLLDTVAATELKQIRVYGQAEKLQAVREHLFSPLLFPLVPSQIQWHPLPEHAVSSTLTLSSGVTVQWFPLEHPGGALGYRLSYANKVLAYVTDTVARPRAGYLNYIRDVDLLLHECYFQDDQQEMAEKTGHSWISAVLDLVKCTTPKRTALIHLNPLAEALGEEMVLGEEHRSRGMFVPADGECLEF